jgi:aspartate carbamoyltransferase catalytic subunit
MNKQDVLTMMESAEQMKHPLRQYPNKTVIHYGEVSNSLTVFQAASAQLGCRTLTVNIRPETLEDSIQTLHYYGDVLVLMYPHPDAFPRAVAASRIPVLQGGMHCNLAQALTDIYTLSKELQFRGITLDSENRETIHVTFLGYSRTVHSFVNLLNLFPKLEYHYVSQTEINDNLLSMTDVLYVSRRQSMEDYCVNRLFLSKSKPTMILMHPFSRSDEVSSAVDTNPRSVYFHQLENGLYMRMAMLDKVLAKTCRPTLWEWFWIALYYIAKYTTNYIDNSGRSSL